MQTKNPDLAGSGALLLVAFIFGTFSILIRFMENMFGVAMQSLVRFALALLILVAFNLIAKKIRTIPKAAMVRIIFFGLAFAGMIMLFTYAVGQTKIGTTVSLQYAGTIIMSLLVGRIIFKEIIGRHQIAAIILACIGLAVYGGTIPAVSLGMLAAFATGILDGIAHGLRKSLAKYKLPRTLQMQWQYTVAVAAMFVAVLLSAEPAIKQVDLGGVIATLVSVGLLICIGNLLLYGFARVDVNVGAIILASEIFFATALGFVFFGEMPTVQEALGSVMIFGAAILSAARLDRIAWWKRRTNPQSTLPSAEL